MRLLRRRPVPGITAAHAHTPAVIARPSPYIEDTVRATGKVRIELIHGNDEPIVHETPNALSGLYDSVAAWLGNASPVAPSHIAVGTGAIVEHASSTVDTGVIFKSTGADQMLADSLTGTATTTVKRVLLWLKRSAGNVPGSVWVELQTNSSSLPSGTTLTNGISNVVQINSLSTTYQWVVFEFTTAVPITLTATSQWLVVRTSGYTYSAGVTELYWGADQSSPATTLARTHNGTVWSAFSPNTAFAFRLVAAADAAKTTLWGELKRNAMASRTHPSTGNARMLANFATGDANDYLSEIGMFNTGVGGTLLAVAGISVYKTSAYAMNAYWLVRVHA